MWFVGDTQAKHMELVKLK